MAESSTSTWMLSLLLLPFFICFHQTSAAPLCSESWVSGFQTNLQSLETLAMKLSGNNNMNFTNIFPTAEKTCAFPDRFTDGVQSLLDMKLSESIVPHINDHLNHLKDRLALAKTCPNLVDLYCNGTQNSGPIVSLQDFHGKLNTLMQKYKSSST